MAVKVHIIAGAFLARSTIKDGTDPAIPKSPVPVDGDRAGSLTFLSDIPWTFPLSSARDRKVVAACTQDRQNRWNFAHTFRIRAFSSTPAAVRAHIYPVTELEGLSFGNPTHPVGRARPCATSMMSAGRNTRSASSEASRVVPQTKPNSAQARQVREHRDAEPERQHQRGQDDGRAHQHARAADREVGARLVPLLQAQPVEEVDQRVDGEPEHHQQRHHGGELQPAAHGPHDGAGRHDREQPRQQADERPRTPSGRRCASSTAAKATQIGSASLSCPIMRALLRAAMAGRPVTEMVYCGVLLAQVVERAVDPLHHGQDAARSPCRAAGPSPARRPPPWR